MTGDPRPDWYDGPRGREVMLRFGPETGPLVVAALPLFEEANRTRAFTVAILRALAVRGIGSVLPDIPGQGESLVPLDRVSLAEMREGFARAADRVRGSDRRIYAVAIRSGTLLDADAALSGRWHLSPQTGSALVRELTRIKRAGGGGGRTAAGRAPDPGKPVEIAGNRLAPAMLAALGGAASIPPDRTIRLASDAASADRKIDGPALWRRSEPGNDPVLTQTLADDVADWIAACGR